MVALARRHHGRDGRFVLADARSLDRVAALSASGSTRRSSS
jgi:hypothetical protein